jgi:hypothetical protein
MAVDALAAFTIGTLTKIAAFRSVGIAFPGGTPRRGGVCRVIYSLASTSAGAGTAVFSLDLSYDNGGTYTARFTSDTIVLGTVATQGEIYIPYRVTTTALNNGGVAVLVALSLLTITGTNATISYTGADSTGGPA